MRGIPVWRLPSLILAFGVLDQVDALESKDVEELWMLSEKRGLPVEDEPLQEVLVERLRTVVVWEHMALDQLEVECQVMGVDTGDMEQQPEQQRGGGAGIMFKGSCSAERDRQKELIRRLTEVFWQAP